METIFLWILSVTDFYVQRSFSYNLNFTTRRDLSNLFVQPSFHIQRCWGTEIERNLPKVTWWFGGKDKAKLGSPESQGSLHASLEWLPGRRPRVLHAFTEVLKGPSQPPRAAHICLSCLDSRAPLLCHKFFKQLPNVLCISQGWKEEETTVTLPLKQEWAITDSTHHRERQCGLKGNSRAQIFWFCQIYKIIKPTPGLILF